MLVHNMPLLIAIVVSFFVSASYSQTTQPQPHDSYSKPDLRSETKDLIAERDANSLLTVLYQSCITRYEGLEKDPVKLIKYGKFCTCYADEFVKKASNQSIKNMKSGKFDFTNDSEFNSRVSYCKTNFENYEYKPNVKNFLVDETKNGSYLFDGKPHRFTAFKEDTLTFETSLLRTVEYKNNSSLYDIEIDTSREENFLVEISTGKRYRLNYVPDTNDWAKRNGFDLTFFVKDLNGTLLINSRKNTFATAIPNLNKKTIQLRYYVSSQALVCTALKDIKSRMQTNTAISIFKEILLVAIKSYAGASYGGGTFTATTSSGQMVNGTYTTYDNSWLGEHYSRGLDSVFNGSANIFEVNSQLEKLGCGNF